jgi:hypothetical protein
MMAIMKSPQQPGNPTNREPMSRSEKFFKRGLPAILGIVAVSGAAYLTVQSAVNNENNAKSAQAQIDKQHKADDFETALKAAAIRIANPNDVIANSILIDPGNHLYDMAKQFADEHGISHSENGVDTILESSTAIDAAGLIQPKSEFVIATVDVNHDGTDEAIVEVAPNQLKTK